jgi:hypothetical protein
MSPLSKLIACQNYGAGNFTYILGTQIRISDDIFVFHIRVSNAKEDYCSPSFNLDDENFDKIINMKAFW